MIRVSITSELICRVFQHGNCIERTIIEDGLPPSSKLVGAELINNEFGEVLVLTFITKNDCGDVVDRKILFRQEPKG